MVRMPFFARFCMEDSTTVITDQGRKNTDVTHDGIVDGQDATTILQYIAKQITIEDLANNAAEQQLI